MPDLWSHSICLEYSTASTEMLWFTHRETALSMRGKNEVQVEISVDQHSKCVQILTREQRAQVACAWTIFTLPNSKSVYCNNCNLLIHIVYQKCFVVFGLLWSILTTNNLRLTRQLKSQCALITSYNRLPIESQLMHQENSNVLFLAYFPFFCL